MLCQAIANAGVDDPAKVRDAMEALEYEAVSGKITFDEFHNPVKNAAILHIKDGEVLFETSVSPAAPPTATGDPIKIAILGPLTGDVATFGASNRDGAVMAVDEWNAKGGVLGRPIEYVLGDTQCDPKSASDAGKKAIDEDEVKYIVGALCSSATIPISEYANEKGVLQISGPSTNPQVTVDVDGKTKPYIYRACFIDPFQGTVMAQFALDNLGAKTAAVVLDVGNDYIKGLAEYFRAAFEAGGGEVVVWEAFVKEDTDFSAILAKVKAADPDVFFIPTYYDKLNLIAAQAKQKGITAPLLGGDGWDSPDTDLEAADGGYYSNHYSPEDSRPIVQDFVARYEAKFGSIPDAFGTLAYDAANLLLQSINNAGVDDPAAARDAMEAMEYEAVSGLITFDEFHNPTKSAAILHIKDGEVMFETSVSPAAPPAAGEPIKIAILGPLTGDVATFGASNRDGAVMAFEEWNAKGGLLGRPIEYVLGDTQCDPKSAADAGKKAIDEDEVNFILGAVCSSATIPISEYANEKGVLQISATSTNPQVTVDVDGDTKPYIFRACFIDPFQGSVMAKFALENLGAKTAAVVLDVGNDYIKGLAEFFRAAFETGGGEVIVWEAFVKEDTDFSAILAKVKAAGPDVFFIPTYYEKMNLIASQAKQKGITAAMLGGDGWDSPDLDRDAADGGYHSNHYSPEDSRAIVVDFVSKYEAQFGAVPDALAALGYDAANLLCQAIANAGTDDPAMVKDAMEALEYEAVSGLITFDEFHNPVKNAAILHIKDGEVLFEASVSP